MRRAAVSILALATSCTPLPARPDAATEPSLCWNPIGQVIDSAGPAPIATSFIPDSGAETCFDARRRYRLLDLRTRLPAELVARTGVLETTQRYNGIFALEVESGEQWRNIGVLYFVRPSVGRLVPQSCRAFEPVLDAYACDGRLFQADGGLHALQGNDWLAAPGSVLYTERNGAVLRYDTIAASPSVAIDIVGDLQFWAADDTGISTISRFGAVNIELEDGGVLQSQVDASGFDAFHRIDGRTFYARLHPQAGFNEVCEVGGTCVPGGIVTVSDLRAWEPSPVVFESFQSFGRYRWDGGWKPVPAGPFSIPSSWTTMPNTGRAISHRMTFRLPGKRQVVTWLDSPFPEDDLVAVSTPFEVTAAGVRWGTLWASSEDAGTVVVRLP